MLDKNKNEPISNGMKEASQSLAETRAIAEKVLGSLEPQDGATVLALQGDLGSGKTAFSQAVGSIVGVEENMHSPTFVIMKVYRLSPTTHNKQPTIEKGSSSGGSLVVSCWSKLIHIDAYRIEREDELVHLGWHEIVEDKENLILIEWPELVPGLIPERALKIYFEFIDEETREITYNPQ